MPPGGAEDAIPRNAVKRVGHVDLQKACPNAALRGIALRDPPHGHDLRIEARLHADTNLTAVTQSLQGWLQAGVPQEGLRRQPPENVPQAIGRGFPFFFSKAKSLAP